MFALHGAPIVPGSLSPWLMFTGHLPSCPAFGKGILCVPLLFSLPQAAHAAARRVPASDRSQQRGRDAACPDREHRGTGPGMSKTEEWA